MLPDAEPEPYSIGEHIVASSSKLVAIDKILGDILPKGERVLIFSVSGDRKLSAMTCLSDAMTSVSNGLRESDGPVIMLFLRVSWLVCLIYSKISWRSETTGMRGWMVQLLVRAEL
jgi:hypothetical protein